MKLPKIIVMFGASALCCSALAQEIVFDPQLYYEENIAWAQQNSEMLTLLTMIGDPAGVAVPVFPSGSKIVALPDLPQISTGEGVLQNSVGGEYIPAAALLPENGAKVSALPPENWRQYGDVQNAYLAEKALRARSELWLVQAEQQLMAAQAAIVGANTFADVQKLEALVLAATLQQQLISEYNREAEAAVLVQAAMNQTQHELNRAAEDANVAIDQQELGAAVQAGSAVQVNTLPLP